MPVTVLIADDHPATRSGHRKLIDDHPELEFAGAAKDGYSALQLIRAKRPDVALLDLRMPELSGLEILGALASASPSTAALLVSAYPEPEIVRAALQKGARGFASKRTAGEELTRLMLAAARGQNAISADIQPGLIALLGADNGLAALTPRQIEVLQGIAAGGTADVIAAALGISVATVRSTQRVIYEKLGVSDRAEAVAVAMRRGLIT